MKYSIYNASSSHIKIDSASVAPGASIFLDQVSLDLRTLEEQGFIKIRGVAQSRPVVAQPLQAGPRNTPKSKKSWTKTPEVK